MKGLVVSLLTMNVAGIPLIHAHWTARRAALGERLRAGGYDVVALQEAWRDGDALELSEASGLPYYARYERSIAPGSGLAILSRWPIVEKRQLTFTCRPSKLRARDGEAFANKGAIMVRLKTPAGLLDVYDTHVIAEYKNARYRALRQTQVFELAEFVVQNSPATPFVLAGDLNASLDDSAYKILRELVGLDDPCEKGGRESCGATVADDWTAAKRVDHVLLPRGSRASAAVAELAPLPGGEPLSDHKAVAARISAVGRLSPDRKARLSALARLDAAFSHVVAVMEDRLARRSWIPVYGTLLTERYDHQLEQLTSLRERVETARIRTLAFR